MQNLSQPWTHGNERGRSLGNRERGWPEFAADEVLGRLLNERHDGRELLRSREHVDEGEAAFELPGLGTDHTAHHGHLEIGALFLHQAHTAELGVRTILGVLTHAAGVDHDEIGVAGFGDRLEAKPIESGSQLLAIRRIHLAADRPQEVTHRHQFRAPVAEGEGFEPSTDVTAGKRLAGARTRPLCDPSGSIVGAHGASPQSPRRARYPRLMRTRTLATPPRSLSQYTAAMATAVVVAIFTVLDQRLSVLLIERAAEPYAGEWALPGGLLQPGETLEGAASRKLKDETGLSDVFLEQLYTFDAAGDGNAEIVVAYFALLPAAQARLRRDLEWRPAWRALRELGKLAFANERMLDYARERLRSKLDYTNVAYSLVPLRFTLRELQGVYEAILEETIDKRNFRKRVVGLDIVRATSETRKEGAHRPARLYEFTSREPMVLF